MELKRKVFLDLVKEEQGTFDSELRSVIDNVDKLVLLQDSKKSEE